MDRLPAADRSFARANHHIESRGELGIAEPKSLSDTAFPAIAHDSRSDPTRDADPQPAVQQIIGDYVNHQRGVGPDAPLAKGPLEGGLGFEPHVG
jgi:hypothetical protein